MIRLSLVMILLTLTSPAQQKQQPIVRDLPPTPVEERDIKAAAQDSLPKDSTPKPPESTKPETGAAAQDSEPSAAETEDWIKEKLAAYGSVSKQDPKNGTYFHEKAEYIAFEGCTFTFRRSFSSQSGTVKLFGGEWDFRIPLADLDSERVEVTDEHETKFVTIRAKEGKTFKGDLHAFVMTKSDNISKQETEASLPVNDEEMAGRIAKAFAHLIKLCNKKEPF